MVKTRTIYLPDNVDKVLQTIAKRYFISPEHLAILLVEQFVVSIAKDAIVDGLLSVPMEEMQKIMALMRSQSDKELI